MYNNAHVVHMLLNVAYSELRQHLAENLDAVANGDTILVERRGKVVAKIVPVGEPQKQPSWKRKIKPMAIQGVSIAETMDYIRSESWREP